MSYGNRGYDQSWPSYPPAPGPGYGPAYGPPLRTSAPASIHVVAILQYLGGFLGLLVAALFAFLAVSPSTLNADQLRQLGLDGQTLQVLQVVCGIVAGVVAFFSLIAIVLGRKVQRGRNWARIILIILNVLSIAGSVLGAVQRQGVAPIDLSGLVLPVLYLILLNTRAARSWCHYRTY